MPAEIPLASGDRVLVTGASGWLGSMLMSRLLPHSHRRGFEVRGVASIARTVTCNEMPLVLGSLDDRGLAAWEPTVLVHAAFVTREHLAEMGEREFTNANRRLTDRALDIARLPSIRSVVHVSSGAAVADVLDVYGQLKVEQESRFEEVAASGGPAVVNARVWSVSGASCPKPHALAFTSFVQSALTTGRIHVRAPGAVWRRYVDGGEFMELAVRAAASGRSTAIDSTGTLVELHRLAARVSDLLGGSVTSVDPDPDVPPQGYFSNSTAMMDVALTCEMTVSSLDEQIMSTAIGLPAIGR